MSKICSQIVLYPCWTPKSMLGARCTSLTQKQENGFSHNQNLSQRKKLHHKNTGGSKTRANEKVHCKKNCKKNIKKANRMKTPEDVRKLWCIGLRKKSSPFSNITAETQIKRKKCTLQVFSPAKCSENCTKTAKLHGACFALPCKAGKTPGIELACSKKMVSAIRGLDHPLGGGMCSSW